MRDEELVEVFASRSRFEFDLMSAKFRSYGIPHVPAAGDNQRAPFLDVHRIFVAVADVDRAVEALAEGEPAGEGDIGDDGPWERQPLAVPGYVKVVAVLIVVVFIAAIIPPAL